MGEGTFTRIAERGQRYRCISCGQTFAATKGTPFYLLRTAADADVVTLILTLLSHGCPTQAIVAAFGFDERTMAAWLTRAGPRWSARDLSCQREFPMHEVLGFREEVESYRKARDDVKRQGEGSGRLHHQHSPVL